MSYVLLKDVAICIADLHLGDRISVHLGYIHSYSCPTMIESQQANVFFWVWTCSEKGVDNMTAPDGLSHTTIWEDSIGNHLKKGRHFEKILGRWLDKPSICHRQSWTDFNQSDQQTIGPVERVGKSNSYWREKCGTSFHQAKPSVLFFALLSIKKYSPGLIELMLAASSLTTSIATIVVCWVSHT